MGDTGRRASSGAYGIRLHGLEAAAGLLVPVGSGAPAYVVSSEVSVPTRSREHVGDDEARLQLRSGGEILIGRTCGQMRFRVPHAVRPGELVHPYMAPAAAVANRWLGRESVHAGAIAIGGRALGVVGAREAGKSSTLAWLARAGVEVLCDDLVVVDGCTVLPGPRSVDLREDAAARLGAGEPIGVTGARPRWRLRLGPVGAASTLHGWVFLGWGPRVEARALPASERIGRLAAQRGLRLPPVRPDALLELASLPAWELSRPRRWSSLEDAAKRLLDLARATPTGAG